MSPDCNKQRGFGVLGWLLWIVIAIIVSLVLAISFYEGRKAYWDSRVREMCEKDGGVQIFEKMSISKAEADLLPRGNGKLGVTSKDLASANAPAYSNRRSTRLNEWNPEVQRIEHAVIRRADQKIVARWIQYGRIGGDFPSIAHPSSFACPDAKRITSDLERLFIVEGGSK